MALFDFVWDNRWSNQTKPVDRDRPFHRINAPEPAIYNETRPAPDGRGYDCGCRSPGDAGDTPNLGALDSRLIVIAPGWVPVERTNVPPAQQRAFTQIDREVEGVLWRSFQTWTDVPMLQWHRWYDWNFHVVPAKGYQYIRGRGNDPGPESRPENIRPVGNPRTMECEWDCGAFSSSQPNLSNPGPMFGTSRDWCWPFASQYFWATGRWIYDCGHATSRDKAVGLHRTELHPCKAIATARWEAVKFTENSGFTPAIQFMFFANVHGGYKNFDSLSNQDYEFLVDLPRRSDVPLEFDVGETPDFDMNTLMLRPRLLKKFDYAPFENARGERAERGEADPEISMVPSADQGLPKQARIKIPLTKLEGKDKKSYGVIVSLGWYDLDGSEAARMKKVTVVFENVRVLGDNHDTLEGEWQLKFGVNGRWTAHATGDDQVENDSVITLNRRFVMHLAPEDSINVAVHGMEEDPVGDFMKRRDANRTFRFDNGNIARWDDDIDQPDSAIAADIAAKAFTDMAGTLADQNDPLGLIDPGHPMLIADTPNPITVREVLRRLGGTNGTLHGTLTAMFTEEEDGSAELLFDSSDRDYLLNYRIEISDPDQ